MNIEGVIRALEETNHTTIAEQLRAIPAGMTLGDKWEPLLIDNAAKLEMNPKEIQEFLIRDVWENRFNLELETNLVAQGASNSLLNTPFDLVTWSSGPNGKNELCNGDDIVLQPPIHRNR